MTDKNKIEISEEDVKNFNKAMTQLNELLSNIMINPELSNEIKNENDYMIANILNKSKEDIYKLFEYIEDIYSNIQHIYTMISSLNKKIDSLSVKNVQLKEPIVVN